MKFSITNFFSKCDQIRSFMRIWSHLLKKSVMENFSFCAVQKTTSDKVLFIISAHHENHIKHFSLTRFNFHSEWYHLQYDDKVDTLGIVN